MAVPEAWHGRHPRQGEYERGYRDGHSTRNKVGPPASVSNLMIGHASWVIGVSSPDSEDFAVAIMARDWLRSLE